jgi:Histone H1-like nucleoprotein HC2
VEHGDRCASKEADMETRPGSKTDERGTDGALPLDAPVETPEADPRTLGAPDPLASPPELDERERWGRGDEADDLEDGPGMVGERGMRSPGGSTPAKPSTTADRLSPKKSAAKRGGAKKTTAKRGAAKKTTAKRGAAKKTTAKRGGPKKTTAKRGAAKKTTAKRGAAKKTTAKRGAAKKTTAKRRRAG